jgi:hypothetical protein
MPRLRTKLPALRVLSALIVTAIFVGSACYSRADAQESSQAWLTPVDSSAFPVIAAYLDIRDSGGNMVGDLRPEHITVVEDGSRLSPSRFELVRSGVQFVLAVSPGPSFAIRDSQGVSRFDYIAESLAAWAGSQEGANIDDLSFLASGGPEATHLREKDRFLQVLGSYRPPGREASPDVDILASAIDIAADSTPQPGMGRGVLFITSLPTQEVAPSLQNLAARANQRGVRIFIWLVASSDQFSSPAAVLLSDLASSTGGRYFAYSGQEPIPELEAYLEPLRSTYYLEFESLITTSGLHQVSVEVKREGLELTTPVQEFELEVLPPSPAFISIPMEVIRTAPEENPGDLAALTPRQLPLEMLVEFPDGHPRPLRSTSLMIDGVSVQANTTPPFEHFVWDLSAYTTSGEHVLVAEAIDSLNLTGRTVETTVLVRIDVPRQTVLGIISQNRSALAILSVLIAGAVLLLVLVVGGRLQPGFFREIRRKRRRTDPVTQPVSVRVEPPTQPRPAWKDRFPWAQRTSVPTAFAYLVPIGDSGEERSTPPLSITRDEEIFGREADLVTQVLDDGSVEPIHARLLRTRAGEYRIKDEGSVAGTWVNYTPISKEGVRIEHGDLVHIGRLGFRFVEREPKRLRKPVARPGEPPFPLKT